MIGTRRVWDCFTFFNELDLLEIRLNVLKDVVDRFVLVEATRTHTGKDKPLWYEQNRKRFAAFADRIVHVVVEDLSEEVDPKAWTQENLQRNRISEGLVGAEPDDIVMVSDLDEIPNPERVIEAARRIAQDDAMLALDQTMFYYYVNYIDQGFPTWRMGTKVQSYRKFLHGLDHVDVPYGRFNVKALNRGTTANKIRIWEGAERLADGGWHFSYLGGTEAILKKLKCFAHIEFSTAEYADPELVKRRVAAGEDLFRRPGHSYRVVPVDDTFPTYLRENRERYAALFLPDPPAGSASAARIQYGLVTTIITAHNHERFIAAAIESAVAQRGRYAHEILVSDDASTDGTRDVIRQYASRYPGLIRDVSSDTNLGISGNLRKCFALAQGDFVAILEGDDCWTDPCKLEKQRAYLSLHADCSMVFSRIRMTDGEKTWLLPRHDRLPSKLKLSDVLKCEAMNPICNLSCAMFRTDYLRILPEIAYEHRLSEVTLAFFLAQIGPIGFIRETMSDYRQHPGGTFSGAGAVEKCRQALQTFGTVRKVTDPIKWPMLDAEIERMERALDRLLEEAGAKRISIVTITRNNREGFERTAQSVLSQTQADFEWIVIDGGSTDGTVEYIASLKRQPDHLVSEPDTGVYNAMNKGIAAAHGVYVICLNAGDVFHSPETLRQVCDHGLGADVVYGDWHRVYGDRIERMRAPKQMEPLWFFRHGCNICQQAMFVRTRRLQESPFDEGFRIVADYAKWRDFMLEGRTFRYVPVVVCDFEAGIGMSDLRTWRNIVDNVRLANHTPRGVFVETAKLKYYRVPCAAAVRLCRRGFECLRDNGILYTGRNILRKLKRIISS